jgi:hypothetical protein
MFMDDNQHTIGLNELLDEVSRDLDEFRKKHSNDYGVKNVTLWWALERERLMVRHAGVRAVRQPRRAHLLKWLTYLFAGAFLVIASSAGSRLLVP